MWGKKVRKLIGKKSGKYYKRTNIITGLVNNNPVAPLIFNGACNTELFNRCLQESLLKELEPGQVVVMDNASFHKSPKTRELIESAGCKLIYFPSFSPDLNPIEKFWANLKQWLKVHSAFFSSLYFAISYFFSYLL